MKEYIERAHVLKFMNALYEHHLTMRNYSADSATLDCMGIVINAPAADVEEVVRCKDCKHFPKGMAVGMCKRVPDKVVIPVPYNNYCGFGERRNK